MKPLTIKQKTMEDREEMLYIFNSGEIHTHANVAATHDDVRPVCFGQYMTLFSTLCEITGNLDDI